MNRWMKYGLMLLFLIACNQNAWAKVNHITGDYSEWNTDFRVQASGGPITIQRYYLRGASGFNFSWKPLRFGPPRNGIAASINRNELIFNNLESLPNFYSYEGDQRILRTPQGYEWKNRNSGEWVNYDPQGLFLAAGSYGYLHVSAIRDTNGEIIGLRNARGIKAIWYTHSNGRITAIHDASGRGVSYQYDATGHISQFTDVRGFVWHYRYNAQGLMSGSTDLGCRNFIVNSYIISLLFGYNTQLFS